MASINAFADTLDNFVRPGSGGTVISSGMNKSLATLTGNNGFESANLIMDVSGDGTSTITVTQAARDAAASAGVTVNGITIGSTSINDFYNANVITSNGFSLHAADFGAFADGVKQKLRIETQPNQIPEPASLTLVALGLFSIIALRHRRKQI